MIATSNSSDSFVTSNENNVKAVQSSRIHANYKNNLIDKNGGYGNYIKLECEVDNIKYEVIYGHLYPNEQKKVAMLLDANRRNKKES